MNICKCWNKKKHENINESSNIKKIEIKQIKQIQQIQQIKQIKQIKVIIKDIYDKIKFEKEYNSDLIVENIIKEFEKEEKKKKITTNEKLWLNIDETKIDLNKTLNELLLINNNSILELKYKILGLINLALNYEEYIINNTKVIGYLFSQPFKTYVYDKKLDYFKKIHYKKENIISTNIKTFSCFSSYCTGINQIYIFGGEEEGIQNNSFWIIDLIEAEIKNIHNFLPSRKFHSMIYIPIEYVFIVGGENNLEVNLYNISSNKFLLYGRIDEELFEPGLCYINNTYLYTFSHNKSYSIYKINLKGEINWEKINIKIINDFLMHQTCFGVCNNYKKKEIIFIGGLNTENNGDKKLNIFNYENNELYESAILFNSYDLKEKNFIPFEKGKYYQILNSSRDKIVIVFFNMELNTIKEKSFVGNLDIEISQIHYKKVFDLNKPLSKIFESRIQLKSSVIYSSRVNSYSNKG